MPPPERMLATLRRAIDAVRTTPGRSGHLLRLPPAADVLVAGDLHGHIPNFQTILRRADLANHPTLHLVFQELIHGRFRYPNGGDKSHQLVDLFAALKCQYPQRVHYLPGNHELAQRTNRPVGKGSESYNDLFRDGVRAAYGSQAGEIYQAYMELFRIAPLMVRTPNGVLVTHSLPAERYLPLFDPRRLEEEEYTAEDLQPGGFVYTLVWGRDTDEENVLAFLQRLDADLLVTGHIPTDEGFLIPNDRQLIVDCADVPAACVLFPTDPPLTHAELVHGVIML
ncbi:MAG: metallophosphoesterase [Bacteroidales bacterium]|nr:metallophosphoesterase [Bacteroidales bacterium]